MSTNDLKLFKSMLAASIPSDEVDDEILRNMFGDNLEEIHELSIALGLNDDVDLDL